MPNTNPPTANMKEFNNKLNLAKIGCIQIMLFILEFQIIPDLAKFKGLDGCCGVKTLLDRQLEIFVDKEEDIEKYF